MRGDTAFSTPSSPWARIFRGVSARRPPAPPRLGLRELDRLARASGGALLIMQGSYVVRRGHPFHGLYAVRSGFVEARVTDAVGHTKVLAQYRPGEIIGLDAKDRGSYPADFVALDTASVCAIPLSIEDQFISGKSPRH